MGTIIVRKARIVGSGNYGRHRDTGARLILDLDFGDGVVHRRIPTVIGGSTVVTQGFTGRMRAFAFELGDDGGIVVRLPTKRENPRGGAALPSPADLARLDAAMAAIPPDPYIAALLRRRAA